MKNVRVLLLVTCLVCLSVHFVPKAKADEWNRKSTVTFSQPVQLPGIVLPAGTYIFRLLDYKSGNNFVQILSPDKKKVYATIRTVPDYRLNPSQGTSFLFEERASHQPQALKAWFFPGNRYGNEFVYSKAETLNLAKADEPESANKPVDTGAWKSADAQPEAYEPVMTAENSEEQAQQDESDYLRLLRQHQTDTADSTVGQEEQTGQPEETDYLQLLNQRQMEAGQEEQTPVETAMLGELPKTGSFLPLIGLAGILSLAGGVGLRLFSIRIR